MNLSNAVADARIANILMNTRGPDGQVLYRLVQGGLDNPIGLETFKKGNNGMRQHFGQLSAARYVQIRNTSLDPQEAADRIIQILVHKKPEIDAQEERVKRQVTKVLESMGIKPEALRPPVTISNEIPDVLGKPITTEDEAQREADAAATIDTAPITENVVRTKTRLQLVKEVEREVRARLNNDPRTKRTKSGEIHKNAVSAEVKRELARRGVAHEVSVGDPIYVPKERKTNPGPKEGWDAIKQKQKEARERRAAAAAAEQEQKEAPAPTVAVTEPVEEEHGAGFNFDPGYQAQES